MTRIWTVIEKVGQEYLYRVEAKDAQEAIEKVKSGEAGTAKHTKEMKPSYDARLW